MSVIGDGNIGIVRCTAASIVRYISGQSFYQRVEAMLQRFAKVFVIFEFDGVEVPGVRIDGVQFALVRLAGLRNVRVFSCATQLDVAALLARWWRDEGEIGTGLCGVDYGWFATNRVPLRLLTAMPGVSLTAAIVLLQRIATLRDIVSADAALLSQAYSHWSIKHAQTVVNSFRRPLH